jgi:hypothetical protein
MPRPIFIVGTMRSGSTLLRLILDGHPDIAIGEETGFMGAVAATKAIPNWRYGREWYGRLGWTESELDERLRDFYSGMFERFAERQGKKRWGEKTPLHSEHIASMSTIFPDAVFVAIVRHPGAVASSLKKRFHYSVPEGATYWSGTNAEIVRRGAELGDDRFALVRYEDVVTSPEPTLRSLVDWLGESWSDDLLRHHDVQAAKGAPRLVDGSTSTREPIRPERADAWREALSPEETAELADRTAGLAPLFGYAVGPEPDGSATTEPYGLVTGGGLAGLVPPPSPAGDPEGGAPLVASMSPEDMAERIKVLERSLHRIRSRPVVRAADAVRRVQKRLPAADPSGLRAALARARRRSG